MSARSTTHPMATEMTRQQIRNLRPGTRLNCSVITPSGRIPLESLDNLRSDTVLRVGALITFDSVATEQSSTQHSSPTTSDPMRNIIVEQCRGRSNVFRVISIGPSARHGREGGRRGQIHGPSPLGPGLHQLSSRDRLADDVDRQQRAAGLESRRDNYIPSNDSASEKIHEHKDGSGAMSASSKKRGRSSLGAADEEAETRSSSPVKKRKQKEKAAPIVAHDDDRKQGETDEQQDGSEEKEAMQKLGGGDEGEDQVEK